MIPWENLDSTLVPGDGLEMTLHRRDEEYSIRLDGHELMNSRVHGSEEALAELAWAKIKDRPEATVLVGGLGMGFTCLAALKNIGRRGHVEVAELVPKVVEWNKEYLGHLADYPLKDRRLKVKERDVAEIIRSGRGAYDAILLDVDNGPDGLTLEANDWLYTPSGLEAIQRALKPGGVLSVWAASGDNAFTKRLRKAGFKVEEHRVHSRGASRGGRRHIIWVAVNS